MARFKVSQLCWNAHTPLDEFIQVTFDRNLFFMETKYLGTLQENSTLLFPDML